MVKRKYANRPNWKRIKEKIFLLKTSDQFEGTIVYLGFKQVSSPLWKRYSERLVKILDTNYWWVHFFPTNQHYTITAMIDEKGYLVQLYFDICKTHGLKENGIPWYDDLYLDVVVLPDGKTELLDSNELINAYKNGYISLMDYEKAQHTALILLENINQHMVFYQKFLLEIRKVIENNPL